MIDPETPLWKLTVSEFLELQEQTKPKPEKVRPEKSTFMELLVLPNYLVVQKQPQMRLSKAVKLTKLLFR